MGACVGAGLQPGLTVVSHPYHRAVSRLASIDLPSRRIVALVAGLVGAYLLLRLTLLWRFPPHYDESLFAFWAWVGYEDPAQRWLPLADGQNPMQEWLGMGLIALGIEPLTSLRLLSLLAGLVAMATVAWLARGLAGKEAALAAAAIWVVLPFSLVYGVVGVADPIIAALAALAMALQMSLARRPRLDLAIVLGLVFGVGILVKLTMMSAVWLLPLGALLFDWRRERLGARLVRWLGCLALAGLIALALYQVLRLSPLWPELADARDAALARHGLGTFLDDPGYWIERNWAQYRLAFRGYLTVPVIAASAVGLALMMRRSWRVGLYVLGWIAVPVAGLAALASEPFLRWLLVVVPPIVVLGGVGAVEMVRAAARLGARRGEGTARLAGAAVCVVLLVPGLVWSIETIARPDTRLYPSRDDIDFVQGYSAGGPWFEVVDQLRSVPGQFVVTTGGNGLEYPVLALRDRPIRFVPASVNDPAALLALRNTRDPLPPSPEPLAWRTLRRWERPRDGLPVTLSERGVLVDGRFASTPAQLRRLLGGDEALDRYAADHPPVARWLAAWQRAHPST